MASSAATKVAATDCVLDGVWVPTRTSEWESCPVPEEKRDDWYLFTFTRTEGGSYTWTGEVPEIHRVYHFGSREPLKLDPTTNEWKGRAGDAKHGKFPCKIVLCDNGDLKLAFGDGFHTVYYATRPSVRTACRKAVRRVRSVLELFVPPIVGVFVGKTTDAFTSLRKSKVPEKFSADPKAPRLRLVKHGSPNQIIFEHVEALRKGEVVPLTLSSPPGKAVVHKIETEQFLLGHYHMLLPAVGDASIAVRARLDAEAFLTVEANSFVFDVNMWDYSPGTKLWMLKEQNDPTQRMTRNPDGGRSFKLNPDGTISPSKASELVLGFGSPDVSKGVVAYAATDVPAGFLLPTMGEKFMLQTASDEEEPKQMQLFEKQTYFPLVFSGSEDARAHWYVSEIAPDGAFKLSVDAKATRAHVRLDVLDAGETLKVVPEPKEGTWFVAQEEGADRVRIAPKAKPCLFITMAEKHEWDFFTIEMCAEAKPENALVVKAAEAEADEEEE